MTLSRDDARRLLGLEGDYDQSQLSQQVQEKTEDLKARIESAPTDALKAKYQQQLDSIKEAQSVLAEKSQASPIAGLSQTMVADLPGAAPSFTAVDGAVAGEGLNLAPGTLLANRYEIIERIGVGGMGAVFRTRDKTRGEEVALKVMLPNLMQSEKARSRFLNEAKVSSSLSHPNIVNVFDVQADGDLTFLSMELLEGQDLRAYLTALNGRPLSVNDALDIVKPICEALTYAHGFTVHRDIKPENIWMTETGEYKLMDFGIARVQSASQMTKTGASLGTAYYMAPEQLKGVSNIDGRADQYSMAVMLYEMLTGTIPTGRIKSLRELNKKIPKKLSNAVDRALEPDPADRFDSMKDFVAALGGKTVKGQREPMHLPPILPILALVIASGAGIYFYGNELKEMFFPDPKIEQEAIRLRSEVDVLADQLEDQDKKLDKAVRDAESNVRRMEGILRSARTNSDKRTAERNLESARSEKAYADRARELADDVIFNRRSIANLEADQGLAEQQLRSKKFKDARENFLNVKALYETKLSQAESSDDVLFAREDGRAAMNSWADVKRRTNYGGSTDGQTSDQLINTQFTTAESALIDGDFAKATVEYGKLVNLVKEESTWARAWSTNSEQEFDNYLNSYPNGRHAQSALDKLEDYIWNQSRRSDNGDAYARYKSRYPSGKYISDAEEATWSWAKRVNSEPAFAQYQSIWPQGKYVAEVPARKEDAAYAYAKRTNSLSAYRNFSKNYPSSSKVSEIRALEDRLAFSIARNNNTIDAYNNYLRNYPSGKYRQDAENGKVNAANQAETNAFNSAKNTNTESAYRDFIRRYPNSRLVSQAIERVPFVASWQTRFGGTGVHHTTELLNRGSSGFMVSGFKEPTLDSNRTTGWTGEVTASGGKGAVKTHGGSSQDKVNALAMMSNGDIIMAGKTKQSSSSPVELWVARVAADGKGIWKRNFKGSGTSEAHGLLVDSKNNILVVGSTYTERTSFDAWVLKLDERGGIEWQQTYGTPGRDEALSAVQADDGGYLIAGSTTGQSTSLSNAKTRVFKVGPFGRLLWDKEFKSANRNGSNQIAKRNDNSYIVSGWLYPSRRGSTESLMLLEVNSSGGLVWSKTFTGYKPGGIDIRPNGDILVASGRNGSGEVLFLDGRGNTKSTKQIRLNTTDVQQVLSLSDGNIVVAGISRSSSSYQEIWVSKLRPATKDDVLSGRY